MKFFVFLTHEVPSHLCSNDIFSILPTEDLTERKSYSLPKDQIKSIQETKLETEFQII